MAQEYDIFLSFKNLGPDGKPTRDNALAHDVYEYLNTRGLQVFYSNISLEKLGVSAYKRAIDDALDSSKVLVAVGTSGENLDSQWVRYEWDSFYNDILSNVKPNGRVFVYVEYIELSTLPRALRQSQVINHKAGSLELLYNFIANAFDFKPMAQRAIQSSQNNSQIQPALEEILKEIDDMIHALENFHSNPEGIYYIGQTLVKCDSFLQDHRISDEAEQFIGDLMDELDSDERKEMGALDPTLSVGKIRKLIRRLKEIRKTFLLPESA